MTPEMMEVQEIFFERRCAEKCSGSPCPNRAFCACQQWAQQSTEEVRREIIEAIGPIEPCNIA